MRLFSKRHRFFRKFAKYRYFVQPQRPRTEEDPARAFQWRKTFPQGQKLTIIGLNGNIRVHGTSRSEARVSAPKRGDSTRFDEVKIEVEESFAGATIRVIYPQTLLGHDGTDVEVNFTVELPWQARFVGETTNGDIQVTSIHGDTKVSTINGGINIQDTSCVQASTINGPVIVSISGANSSDSANFRTLNGPLEIGIPASANTKLLVKTNHGRVSSDFPLTTMAGSRTVLAGTVGEPGDRKMVCETVTGDIYLHQID